MSRWSEFALGCFPWAGKEVSEVDTYDRLSGEVTTGGARFATQWDRPVRDESEHPSSATQTEMAYVPPQVQIMDMMDAGARLQAARRARFDTVELQVKDDLGDDMPLDPTRNPGADMVDVTRAADAARARLVKLAGNQKEAQDGAKKAAADVPPVVEVKPKA